MTYTTNAFAHGIGNSAVSSQWFSRPDDQKFLTLDDMLAHKKVDAQRMTSRTVDTHKVKIIGDFDEANPSRGNIFVEYTDENKQEHYNAPTNWSFGQLSQLAGAPAGYLKDLPAPLAADCIQWGLKYNRSKDLIKVYGNQANGGELRAATGPDYGRIYDWEILDPIKNLIDESGGRWKVPGMMVGSRNGLAVYDPEVPVSMDTTTLFASDRDVFVFLVDDRNPIEVGKLPNGEPDLMFRGFYAWNSETGSKTAGIAAMYLRGVCMNRNLWGVENFEEIKIRHTKFAPDRFAMEARPALQSFANGSTHSFIEGVQAAKDLKVAKDDEERLDFLTKRAGLSGRMAKAASARHFKEEGRPVETVWDAAQAITAIARDVPHQDARIQVERKAGALLDKVTA
tara:strand:+ start:2866 stop:4056 length:1191 start_codon:yes stop_codon:yes gene_type:complete